ncbi:helix-turn-helix domain-containing protein [Dyadobacter arcticus]|uniref:AraC-like DNA-binding protein n=1 Tax=Dyadobacter arcticus TaxID=1078754 RepID=A0ABX0UNK1_9BACT|nr:helix-turn-helix domain-containing protein [Dyadobacter arcticus]NIJ54559.1 AraC-like DNA-binding protein [Dyadobacter arcticus]
MKTITTLPDYCRHINIPPPKYAFFDIRRFEDKTKTENAKQAPFRHEFYAVALRHAGKNKEVNGQPLQADLFFNSPYQTVSWDVLPDWKGWYIMFGQDFLVMNPAWKNFILDFPFFRLDQSIPFDLSADDMVFVTQIFERIFDEYVSDRADKFLHIQTYTQLLLILTKRYFNQSHFDQVSKQASRTADILLVSRFQSLIETAMTAETAGAEIRQTSFYANTLRIHPNHLNAVVKRITGSTATNLIQNQLTISAKSLLQQTTLSAKEIAFRLHFSEATHFNAFFKKRTGLTPRQYRETQRL